MLLEELGSLLGGSISGLGMPCASTTPARVELLPVEIPSLVNCSFRVAQTFAVDLLDPKSLMRRRIHGRFDKSTGYLEEANLHGICFVCCLSRTMPRPCSPFQQESYLLAVIIRPCQITSNWSSCYYYYIPVKKTRSSKNS